MIDEIEREEIYDFLEHVGVKGMRWGSRKARDSSSGRTPAQKEARKKAVVKGLKIGAVVGTAVVGAAVAGYFLKKHGATKVSDLKPIDPMKTREYISMHRMDKMADIRRLNNEKKITARQAARLSTLVNKQFLRELNILS